MVARDADRQRLDIALGRAPVVLLVGPRQAGKSTIARDLAGASPESTFFDLEDPRDVGRLAEPLLALEGLRGLVVIDEAQRTPQIFPVLRVLADRPGRPATFLVLGSASPELITQGSESLAGRVEIVELGGLRVTDVGESNLDRLWVQGGLPASYVRDDDDSTAWRRSYVSTFLERDLAQLGSRVPASQMRRFWTMLAHYHGQTWNGSELARALAVSQPTTRRYLDALTDALVVRQLQPWFANIGKRVVRSPKVYLRDSGVLHTLLGLDSMGGVLSHPKVGASWEGFVVEQVAITVGPLPLYFWGTQSGAELDMFFVLDGRNIGVEIKRVDVPTISRSMRNAITDLQLDHLFIVTPGTHRYPLAAGIEVLPLADIGSIA